MAGPRVSALIVTYNHADEIDACLDAALAQDGADVDVIVCDNASSDGTQDVLRRRGDAITLICHGENVGFAAGVNAAFAAARTPYVLLLNPDCVMDGDCVRALADHLDAHPGTAMAAASLRWPDGRLQDFARREFGAAGALTALTEIGRRLDQRVAGGRWLEHRRYGDVWKDGLDGPVAVDCPAAACLLARRSVLLPRPLDTAFPIFFNDAELCRRLRQDGGWTIEVVPAATAEHGYGTSVRRVPDARRRAEFVASLWRYSQPWGTLQRLALLAGLTVDALAGLALVRAGRGRPDSAALARGTLGGLGLGAGAEPWLSAPALRRIRRR